MWAYRGILEIPGALAYRIVSCPVERAGRLRSRSVLAVPARGAGSQCRLAVPARGGGSRCRARSRPVTLLAIRAHDNRARSVSAAAIVAVLMLLPPPSLRLLVLRLLHCCSCWSC
jgi:hypothetical protein